MVLGILPSMGMEWAAGLFEGEGCVSRTIDDRNAARKRTGLRASRPRKTVAQHIDPRRLRPSKAKPTITASLVTTDKDVMQHFVDTVGIGSYRSVPPRTARHKTSFRWMIYGDNARRVITMLWPWLGARRRARATELWNATVNRNEVQLPCE